jgi:hypothetical protein
MEDLHPGQVFGKRLAAALFPGMLRNDYLFEIAEFFLVRLVEEWQLLTVEGREFLRFATEQLQTKQAELLSQEFIFLLHAV